MRLWIAVVACCVWPASGQYLVEGVKVGEVTPESAVVWTRVSKSAAAVPGSYKGPSVRGGRAEALAAGVDAATLPGAVPGSTGQVRIRYSGRWSEWTRVTAATDYTHRFALLGLKPATRYSFEVQSGSPGKVVASVEGSFTTAPLPEQVAAVSFTVVTGLMYRDLDDASGYKSFAAMDRERPNFLVLTGDNVYYDNEPPRATTEAVARYHWQRMFSLPVHTKLFAHTPAYWEKDDHDTLDNDSWPGKDPQYMRPMTFERGRQIFLEQTPVPERTYRTFRWGKQLQVWLVEGRDFRSPNDAPDGPGKTILGAKQIEWLKKSVEASDAAVRVIVSPTPWVGPDRGNKGDNYANKAFASEGAAMRAWASKQKNLFIACGDRHWQYHSVDPSTGLHEFSSGPVSDEHAGGSPGQDNTYHRFHRVKGGFLRVDVDKDGAVFSLRDVNGITVYRHQVSTR